LRCPICRDRACRSKRCRDAERRIAHAKVRKPVSLRELALDGCFDPKRETLTDW
jgi:hypothetical protein